MARVFGSELARMDTFSWKAARNHETSEIKIKKKMHCLKRILFSFRCRFISQLPLQAVSTGGGILCDNIPGLIGKQRRMCRAHQDAMVSIRQGAKEGVKECQYQFRKHRWNCSTLDRDASVFGKVLLKGKINVISVLLDKIVLQKAHYIRALLIHVDATWLCLLTSAFSAVLKTKRMG